MSPAKDKTPIAERTIQPSPIYKEIVIKGKAINKADQQTKLSKEEIMFNTR